ncbi:hypothetical protein [Leucobacter allii]|nr:hypothetical protein [Leucobacter allii]
MSGDTFSDAFTCDDCGREWTSLSAVMQCPCDRYDRNGRPLA